MSKRKIRNGVRPNTPTGPGRQRCPECRRKDKRPNGKGPTGEPGCPKCHGKGVV